MIKKIKEFIDVFKDALEAFNITSKGTLHFIIKNNKDALS